MALFISDVQDCPAANTQGAEFLRRQTFSQLPDEILENIFLQDVLKDTDLCALALVNRRIGRLGQVSLYNEITLLLLQKERTLCFSRTLSKHPELGLSVWGARLAGQWHKREACFRKAQQLLKMLPALRTLVLTNFSCSEELASLLDIPMPHLRFISFPSEGGSSFVDEMARANSYLQIRRLWIEYVGDSKMDDDAHEWTHKSTALDALAGKSSLKHLDLERWFDSVLLNSSLLKVPHGLEKLTGVFTYSGRLTPKGTIDALEPLYSTLITLNLTYRKFMADLSGPVADFSCFVCLKSLTVDDSLCFETWSSDIPDNRCGLYKRLPSTLEVLQVSVLDLIC
jgi:hypothetical protein